MNWRDRCREKLVSVEQAIARIKLGDVVSVAPLTG